MEPCVRGEGRRDGGREEGRTWREIEYVLVNPRNCALSLYKSGGMEGGREGGKEGRVRGRRRRNRK
jgi:hypothetical protein